jgi:transposase
MTVSTAREVNSHTGGMTSDEQDPQVPARATRRRYSAKYKLAILAEYEQCNREGKGALLRREKLYTSLISEWRKQRDRGALEGLSAARGRPPVDARDRQIEQLQAERDKLAGELDRTRRVVEVQGKLSALLEDLSAESANNDTERRR